MDLNSLPPVPEESFEIDISNSISRHQVREERTRRSFKRDHASIERKRLPPGWLNCPEFGREIHSIIPSKVPLDESFNDSIPPDKRYTSMQLPIHHPRIGLVIDLSNSLRYYTPSDLLKAGIEYVKIPCKGIDSVPDDMSVDKFVNDVIQFFSDCEKQGNTKKFNMVLVHCTHGHNRTGFMIVHFLVRVHSFSVTRALKRFSDARPPGIYKPDYIDALYAFYNEVKPEAVVCPPTPQWKRFKAVQDDDGDVGSIAPVHENVNDDVVLVMTNDDILGDEIPDVQQRSLKQFCCRMLDRKGTNCWQFPGSHPVSLDRDNLQRLGQRYYYATWKADGTRYMMLITTDGCYLIDRRFNFRRVEMRFPCRIGLVENTTHNYTLLDGEMVIDTVPDSQKLKQERRYLIYDMITFNNVSIIDRPFYERFKMVEKEVIEPRNHERKNRNPYDYRYETEAFRVKRKDFWVLSTVTKILKEFIPRLSHDADGLIFQGWDDPYVPKTHEGLLKWKYSEMNSVDFLFELGENDDPNLLVFERGKRKIMKGDRVKFKDGMDESIYSGKIIECGWDCDEKVWVFMRIRTDKTTPNDIKTYRKVRRSIEDNITEEDLL